MAHGTLLIGGTVIDGTGGEPLEHAAIRIENGKIVAVGRVADFSEEEPPGLETVRVDGLTVLPGLINCHEHLDLHYSLGSWDDRVRQSTLYWVARGARNALIALCEGVTTVRVVGSKDGNDLELRRAIQNGVLLGPRVLAAGLAVAMTGGHSWQISVMADGPDAVRRATREVLHSGADLIKVMASGGFISPPGAGDLATSPQFTVEEMRAAFDEAHMAGKPTTAHCHPPESVVRAVEAGTDCIEHATMLDRPTADLLADRNIPLVPTLGETIVIAERGETLGKPDWVISAARDFADARMQSFRYAVEAGVKLAVGTGTCDSVAEEMELMVRGGVKPMDAVVAATRHGAEVGGIADITGTIEPGKSADLIVIDGNPLEDIRAVSHVERVFVEGRAHRPQDLKLAIGRYPE